MELVALNCHATMVLGVVNYAIMLQTPPPSNVTLPNDIEDRLANLTQIVNRVEVSMRVSEISCCKNVT